MGLKSTFYKGPIVPDVKAWWKRKFEIKEEGEKVELKSICLFLQNK